MYYDVFISCGNIHEAVLTTMLAYTKATRNECDNHVSGPGGIERPREEKVGSDQL